MSAIRDQIIVVVSEISGLDVGEIDTTKSLAELGCDSLDIAEAAMNIEDDTGVTIPEETWQKFKTIDDIVTFVESKA
jgi:acyl carrier protein